MSKFFKWAFGMVLLGYATVGLVATLVWLIHGARHA